LRCYEISGILSYQNEQFKRSVLLLQRALPITGRPGRGKKVNSDKVETLLHITFLGNLLLESNTEGKDVTSARAVFLFEHAMPRESREVPMAAFPASI